MMHPRHDVMQHLPMRTYVRMIGLGPYRPLRCAGPSLFSWKSHGRKLESTRVGIARLLLVHIRNVRSVRRRAFSWTRKESVRRSADATAIQTTWRSAMN